MKVKFVLRLRHRLHAPQPSAQLHCIGRTLQSTREVRRVWLASRSAIKLCTSPPLTLQPGQAHGADAGLLTYWWVEAAKSAESLGGDGVTAATTMGCRACAQMWLARTFAAGDTLEECSRVFNDRCSARVTESPARNLPLNRIEHAQQELF